MEKWWSGFLTQAVAHKLPKHLPCKPGRKTDNGYHILI